MKAHGKKFEYKMYQDAPGGHSFNRLDTKLARDSGREIYRFLAKYLSPYNVGQIRSIPFLREYAPDD